MPHFARLGPGDDRLRAHGPGPAGLGGGLLDAASAGRPTASRIAILGVGNAVICSLSGVAVMAAWKRELVMSASASPFRVSLAGMRRCELGASVAGDPDRPARLPGGTGRQHDQSVVLVRLYAGRPGPA